ncbi:MAG: putative phosphatase YcdX [Candidatus Erwinia impunctatus]|nr:putative phosphatase YcdX [Culicoides impunctatus]
MYPVDLHMHTVGSTHAYSTLHDYIAEARRRNLKLIAITDHGPEMVDAPHEFHFVNMRILPRVVEGVGILRSIEANIKRNGEIDCNDRIRATLDLVVAGFHKPVYAPENSAINTAAMIAAMESGKVDIISHPGNPEYPVDIPEIVRAARHFNVALELNNSSFLHSRLGSAPNCKRIVQEVKKSGGWLSLGSDSHSSFSVGDFRECEKILAETAFPEEQILNVSPERLLSFLQSRGRPIIPEFAQL